MTVAYDNTPKSRLPWIKTFYNIKSRCTNPKEKYCQRGIKCLITAEELKILWFRDKAYTLKQPSIDRINGGNYTFENCRYVEMEYNIKRSLPNHTKPIIRTGPCGKFSKKYKSIQAAADDLGILRTSLLNCLNGRVKTSGGFKWDYL